MDQLTQAFSQIWKGFNTLTPSKKASILAAVIATVVGILIMVYVAGNIEYRVLFSNLGTEDAGAIVAKLKEKKIPYQLSDSGNSVLVPADKVSELRLELASSGLPQGGGVGFEIFDNKTLGVTEFVQQLNYQRALQGELARTINGLDEIQHSRVHIVIPKKSLFTEDQTKPTASVIVKLKAGRSLRPAQIDGIVHLVASSVEGLNPADVMVVDNTGKVLSKIQDDAKLGRLSNSQADYQRGFERDLTSRVQSMLEKVVGEGKAVVRVSADLDFRVVEQMEEKYDPESPVIRSQQRLNERSGPAGGEAPASGAAALNAQGARAQSKQEKSDEITNYEISKTVNKTVMPVGEIKKMSIAVLVDGNYVKNAKGEEEYQARSKKELADLEDLVKKSAGFDAKRDDQIVVTNIPFKKVDVEEEVKVPIMERVTQFYPVLKYVLLMGVGAMVFFLFLMPAVKGLKEKGTVEARPVAAVGEGGAMPQPLAGGGVTAEIQGMPSVPLIGQDMKGYSESEIVKQLAAADARKFADLLRHWIQ